MTSFARRKFRVAGFLLAMTLCNVALLVRSIPTLPYGDQDFTIYYTGARILRNGQASELYNLDTQHRTQLTFTHVPPSELPPFNHPAFEALLFIPLTFLAYWPAYLLWTAFNLIMLAVSVIMLRRQFPLYATVSPLVLGLAVTAFLPLTFAIIRGQDVILLLLLFVLAIICLDQRNDVLAGALLGAGLFRPHMVVPLVILLAIRRWRVFIGFVPVAFVLTAISVAMVGWHGLADYKRIVLYAERAGAFASKGAPNLRGLITEFPGFAASSPWITLLIFSASMIIFFAAFRRARKQRDSILISSGLAATTAILISYHGFVYDLSLLLPIVLFLIVQLVDPRAEAIDVPTVLLAALLVLSPLYVFLLFAVQRFFWFSLILLGLYLWLLDPSSKKVPVLLEGAK